MCEYCGCQQIAAIRELTREHDAVVAEIAEVRSLLRKDDVQGAATTARRIAEILEPHTAVEEGALFPLMAEEFPDHIEALEREHRLVEGVLAEAASGTPADPDWPARLTSALDLLRDHILKEQDGVFPASLSVVDTEGWEQVEAVRARAGSGVALQEPATRLAWRDDLGRAQGHDHDGQLHDHPHDDRAGHHH